MIGSAFDAFSCRAVSNMSRRCSLLTLGGVAMATALAGSSPAVAAKAGKKAQKKCKKQGGQCRTFFAEEACPAHPDPEECKEKSFQCCNALAQCRVAAFFDCLFTP